MAILKKADNPAAVEPWGVVLIEHRKSNAIETHQAIECPQPQIAVPGLRHRNDRGLRQPVVGLPNVDGIWRARRRHPAGGRRKVGDKTRAQQPRGGKGPTVSRHIR